MVRLLLSFFHLVAFVSLTRFYAVSLLPGQESFVAIFDRTGFEMKNTDFQLAKVLLNVLASNYPERLGILHIFPVNWVFWALYKMLKPFMDERTQKKVSICLLFNFIADVSVQLHIITGDYIPVLAKYYAPDQLEPRYGGTSSYTYSYPPLQDLYTEVTSGVDPIYNAAVAGHLPTTPMPQATPIAAAAAVTDVAPDELTPEQRAEWERAMREVSAVSASSVSVAGVAAAAGDSDDEFHDAEEDL